LQKSEAKPWKMIDLHLKLAKATVDKVNTLAGIQKETASAIIRRILDAGLDAEIAEQSLGTITSVIRKVIRSELKSTENRLASLGAKATIAAGTSEHMLTTLFVRSISGEISEKQRQAKEIHDDARRKAVLSLKHPADDE